MHVVIYQITQICPLLTFEVPVKGEVYLYLTNQYPCCVNFKFLRGESDLVIMVNMAESMAPILEVVAHKFSVIKHVYSLFYLLIYVNINFR